MIVFDASGSMAGNLDQGIATLKPRIDEVRTALAKILPEATRFRRVGLITYGPGPGEQCNVTLDLKPTANACKPHHARPRCSVTGRQDSALDSRGESRRGAWTIVRSPE